MARTKTRLLTTTVVPFVVVIGIAVGGAVVATQLAAGPAYAACNPCNPCAGGAASLKCAVPRLQAAAACNPCAVAKPYNPRSPCNPCAVAAGAAQLTDAEAVAVYDCLLNEMRAAYARSGHPVAASYSEWRRYSKNAYASATHGGRYVQNYANPAAKAYGAFEDAGVMPAGAVLAKDSFMVQADGRASAGPLFIMEKMPAGFYDDSDDWRYTMITPGGEVFGTTKGEGSAKVEFCIGCHVTVAAEVDSLFFMPEDYRVR
jgi:hypothetical protein